MAHADVRRGTGWFAALRFAEDENIADRVYWYRAAFPLNVGEKVFAPVGTHDGVQRAEVVRVLADDAPAPYDVRFLKSVSAKCGAYRRSMGEAVVFETGGLPYDAKRFTRYGCVLFGDGVPSGGITPVRADAAEPALRALLRTEGCALLTGACAARTAACLWLLTGVARGEVASRLAMCGADGALPSEAEQAALSEWFSGAELARLARILQ